MAPTRWWVDAEWRVWRLVADEVATLREIDEHWSLSDVLDANEALDVMQDIARLSKPSTPPQQPRTGRTR